MYGTRYRRRGVLRPESTPGVRSRRRLLMRPAAYVILAAAVCVAAATLPSTGKNDQARAAVAPVGNGFTVTPADLAFILKQIKIAERHSRAFEGIPDAGTPLNPDPVGDPDYCQALVGPNEPDPGPAHELRLAHGRRLVQQPVRGPRQVRGFGPAVPAPDDAVLQRGSGQPDRFLRARQRHDPELVVRAEEGLRVRRRSPA